MSDQDHPSTPSGAKISNEELLRELERVADELGRSPKHREFRNGVGEYHSDTYTRRFGSWDTALELAGLEPPPRGNGGGGGDSGGKKRITTTELLDSLVQLAEELGDVPTWREMEELGDHCPRTYHRRFESWSEALDEAGLVDLSDDGHECAECDRRFLTERALHRHISEEHDAAGSIPWFDAGLLESLYWDEGLNSTELAELWGCTPGAILARMEWYDIPRRPLEEAVPSGTDHHNHWSNGGGIEALKDESWLREKHHGENMTKSEIADLLNCSLGAVGAAFSRYDIPENRAAYIEFPRLANKDELEKMYVDQEMTGKEIAEVVGCSEPTVYRWLNEHGIPTRSAAEAIGVGPDHHRWKGGRSRYYGPNWHQQRRKCLERDNNQCVVCGMTLEAHTQKYRESLHVHHITPFRKFGEDGYEKANRLENLLTLCRRHHDEWEGITLRPDIQRGTEGIGDGEGSNA